MEYVNSEKRNRKLVLDGFQFVKDKQVDDKIYWKCEFFSKMKCRARVITESGNVKKGPSEHNHGGDAAKLEVSKFMDRVRIAATSTQDTPQYIISSLIPMVSLNSVARLPEVNNIRRTIRNIRSTHDAAPALPQSRQELVIPASYCTTNRGDDFLLFDSGPTDSRILIFGTASSLDILQSSQHWFMDGTFKTVPHLFAQLYTIHGLKENCAIPLIFVLLPDKSANSYISMLREIKNLRPRAEPESIMIDFERAAYNAISTVYPQAAIRGCFFHFCQCIYRKIQTCGLKQRYDTDVNFSLAMRTLNALAFVPVEHVVRAFEELCEENSFGNDGQDVVDYFEDTWIGRPDRRQRRRAPIFPHTMWNCAETSRAGLSRTNNAVEGWHRSFESQISANHPNIWRFIEALKREYDLNEMKMQQYLLGVLPPSKKKIYNDMARRIQTLLNNFEPTELVDFTKGIAHNISY